MVLTTLLVLSLFATLASLSTTDMGTIMSETTPIPPAATAQPIKLGIIRCMQTEDYCPGTKCFHTVQSKQGAFAELNSDGAIELIGFTNCGGCPGKRVLARAELLLKKGANTIAFGSCVQKGLPLDFPCPFAARMKKLLQNKLPAEIRILDYTH